MLAVAVVLLGCSAHDTVPVPSDQDASPPPAVDAGAVVACNALVNIGPIVADGHKEDPSPARNGGAIVDGTYVRTSTVYYASGAGAIHNRQETWDVRGNVVQRVETRDDVISTETFTYSTAGTSFVQTATCPDTTTLAYEYSATPDEIIRYNPRYNEAATYARR